MDTLTAETPLRLDEEATRNIGACGGWVRNLEDGIGEDGTKVAKWNHPMVNVIGNLPFRTGNSTTDGTKDHTRPMLSILFSMVSSIHLVSAGLDCCVGHLSLSFVSNKHPALRNSMTGDAQRS